jgi:hypothetical protein
MHNITQAPLNVTASSPRPMGEKVLVKALTAIVNREGNRKTPLRKINLSSFEFP